MDFEGYLQKLATKREELAKNLNATSAQDEAWRESVAQDISDIDKEIMYLRKRGPHLTTGTPFEILPEVVKLKCCIFFI